MATIIKGVKSRRNRYDWNLWANGKAYRAERGRDFHTVPESFRSTIYTYAHRKGLSVTVTINGNAVEFQFSKADRSTDRNTGKAADKAGNRRQKAG